MARIFGKRTLWLIAFLFAASLMFIVVLLHLNLASPPIDGPFAVGLYSGRGTWNESVQALEKMFQWMDYSVKLVSADDINNGRLEGFRVMCIPGGDMYQYAQDISSRGKADIRSFIQNGGGYIGVCGGAYFACERIFWRGGQLPMISLGVIQGVGDGPINEIAPYPDYTMCRVNIVNNTHPAMISASDSWMLYYWGPALILDDDSSATVLGRYEKTGLPAIVALNYGRGRVFLIGTHPEIEEDSQRDNVAFADELDDQGSDWELMRNATRWVLDR